VVVLARGRVTGVGVAVMVSGPRHCGIFISYRREETAGQAGRLYDRLSGRFGTDRVFMDVDSIAFGLDFTQAITEAVSRCAILLALIGRDWPTATDSRGRRRIDDPDDFVRVEIEAALARDIPVVPVLVEGAALPEAGDLPPGLRPLVRRQALGLSHAGFGAEVSRLIAAIDQVLGPGRARHRRQSGPDAGRAAKAGGRPERDGIAARLAATAGSRLRREEPVKSPALVKPQDESGSAEGKRRILYASHFPVLGSIIIAVPLFILAMDRLKIIPITSPAPYWVIIVLGLAGIAGSVIDYRNGCGVSAIAVGINSAFLAGYAIYTLRMNGHITLGNYNSVLLTVCAITGIGLIGNGVILAYILRQFSGRRRRIGTPLLLFLVFMASGLALVFIASALTFLSRITPSGNNSLIWVAGLMFLAALLAELTGIGLAVARVFQNPGGQREPGT
jgi:hypothetical protein